MKLSDRLETEAPSRELDAYLHHAFSLQYETSRDPNNEFRLDVGKFWDECPILPSYSSSVDAALVLFREVLPGWSWELRESGYGLIQANLWEPNKGPPMICPENQHRAEGSNGSPAMIFCAAIARAKGL